MPGRTLMQMSEIPFARTQSQKEIHPREVQALMVLDVPSLPESSSDDEGDLDELTLDLDQPRRHKGLRTLHISHLLQMVLQDAQTRLFFKAQSVIQSEIRYYVPKPEDLAYPEKLLGE